MWENRGLDTGIRGTHSVTKTNGALNTLDPTKIRNLKAMLKGSSAASSSS